MHMAALIQLLVAGGLATICRISGRSGRSRLLLLAVGLVATGLWLLLSGVVSEWADFVLVEPPFLAVMLAATLYCAYCFGMAIANRAILVFLLVGAIVTVGVRSSQQVSLGAAFDEVLQSGIPMAVGALVALYLWGWLLGAGLTAPARSGTRGSAGQMGMVALALVCGIVVDSATYVAQSGVIQWEQPEVWLLPLANKVGVKSFLGCAIAIPVLLFEPSQEGKRDLSRRAGDLGL